MDDHPHMRLPLVIRNTATNTDNYLWEANVHKEYVTGFVVRKAGMPPGVFEPLRVIVWNILWHARLTWDKIDSGDPPDSDVATLDRTPYRCRPTMLQRFLVHGGVGKTLDDKNVLAMIKNPSMDVSKTAGNVTRAAIKALDQPGNTNAHGYRTWTDKNMNTAFPQ